MKTLVLEVGSLTCNRARETTLLDVVEQQQTNREGEHHRWIVVANLLEGATDLQTSLQFNRKIQEMRQPYWALYPCGLNEHTYTCTRLQASSRETRQGPSYLHIPS